MGKKIRDLKSSRAHRILDAAKRKRPKRAPKRHDGRSQEVTTALGIVEAHKGHISFGTEVGKGTTFNLTIPIQAKKHD